MPYYDARYSKPREVYTGAAETTKAEIIKPLVLAGVGMLIILLAMTALAGPAAAAVTLPAVLIGVSIRVVLGIIALFIAVSVLGTGAGTLGLAALRLFGIFTFTAAIAIPLSALSCVGLIITLVVLGGLIAWLFELDGSEAIIVVIVLIGVEIAAYFLMSGLVASLLAG